MLKVKSHVMKPKEKLEKMNLNIVLEEGDSVLTSVQNAMVQKNIKEAVVVGVSGKLKTGVIQFMGGGSLKSKEVKDKGKAENLLTLIASNTSRNQEVLSAILIKVPEEAKEAIAHYPEIIKEIKLGLQECGRMLGSYVRKKSKISGQIERANMFEKYIPEVADSLSVLSGEKKEKILLGLQKMLVKPEIKQEILQEDEDDKLYRMKFDKKENASEEVKEEE